jgi:hypothetical protein
MKPFCVDQSVGRAGSTLGAVQNVRMSSPYSFFVTHPSHVHSGYSQVGPGWALSGLRSDLVMELQRDPKHPLRCLTVLSQRERAR